MKEFSYNRWLILAMIIGFLAAMVINLERHEVEEQNKQIDLAVDYEGLTELAQREGLPTAEVLRQAKEAGITSLAVYETTFQKFNKNGKANAVAGSAILANYHSGALTDAAWREAVAKGKIIGTEVYVTGNDRSTFAEVKEDLIRRLGYDRVAALDVGGAEVLAVKAHYESFLKMNLGLPTDEMRAVNEAGFLVLARPGNYENCSPDDVRAVFKRLEGIKISEVVFSGPQILGATKSLQTTVDEMKARNLTLGLIEDTTQLQFYPQDGMWDLAKHLGYNRVARLYAIPTAEQPKMKIAQAVERWANTDHERNIRIDLLRIYEKPAPEMSLLQTNMKYFADTRDALLAKGFTLGAAQTFVNFYPSKFWRAILLIGVAAAVVLYLSLIVPWLNRNVKYQYILLALGALFVAVPTLMGNGNKIRLLASFAAANLLPAIAMIYQLDRLRQQPLDGQTKLLRLMGTAAVALGMTAVISFMGAAYLSGALADVEYMLEFSIFRGIKLTFVLPLILVAVAFLQRFDLFDGKFDQAPNFVGQLKMLLNMPVKLKSLLGIFALLTAGVVFIARSGHTSGMPVSGLEIKFRAFLEQAMYARPRSKELLIGHPAFMLMIMAFKQKWSTMILFLLVVAATIGQGSMVETFAHMRTPVFMSFMRGLGGLALGAGLGAIAMVLAQLWQRGMIAVERNNQGVL